MNEEVLVAVKSTANYGAILKKFYRKWDCCLFRLKSDSSPSAGLAGERAAL
jgi:hypothetical protein